MEALNQCFFYSAEEKRKNLYEVNKKDYDFGNDKGVLERQASRVACLVKKSRLIHDPQTQSYRIADETPKHADRIRYIPPEEPPFKDEYMFGFGTAFQVTTLFLVTAAHCVENTHCNINDTYVVFGYKMLGPGQCQTVFPEDDVCKISRIINRKYERVGEERIDYALFELEKAHGDGFLALSRSPVDTDEPVYVLGYPEGLPLKVTPGGQVKRNDGKATFEIDSNTFGGNSGSPVISRITGLVVGILCRGYQGYQQAPFPFSAYSEPNVISEEHAERVGYQGCQRIAYKNEEEKESISCNGRNVWAFRCIDDYLDMPPTAVLPKWMHADLCEIKTGQFGDVIVQKMLNPPTPELKYLKECALPGFYLFGRNDEECKKGRFMGGVSPHFQYLGFGAFNLESSHTFEDSLGHAFKMAAMGFYNCAYLIEATQPGNRFIPARKTVWKGRAFSDKMRHIAVKERLNTKEASLSISCSAIDLLGILTPELVVHDPNAIMPCEAKYAPLL